MKLILKRHSYHPLCTLGWLFIGAERFATVEKPWINNEPFKSCIPEGDYKLARYSSEKFPNVFEIKDVPNRSYILIHIGNSADDVAGCVAVGRYPSQYGLTVQQSRVAMERVRYLLRKEKDNTISITFGFGAVD